MREKRDRTVQAGMTRREYIAGGIWFLVYLFFDPAVMDPLLLRLGVSREIVETDGIYFLLLFLITALVFRRYLTEGIAVLLRNPLQVLRGVLIAYLCYEAAEILLNVVYLAAVPDLSTPNDELVAELAGINYPVMVLEAVLLGPLVEECLMRGLIYGGLRRKNRVLATIVSAGVFGVLHIVAYIYTTDPVTLLLNLPLYCVPGIVLCLAYEWTGTIWGPVALHMIVNALSMMAIGQMQG